VLPVPHYRIALPRKVSPGGQFTGKNLFRPGDRRAGRIFAGKLSAGGNFSKGGSYNGKTFHGAGDILIKGRLVKFVIIFSRANFSWGDILM